MRRRHLGRAYDTPPTTRSFAFTTDGAREPASPVPREDPLYAAMQARIDANASQLSLARRPLADVLATDPGARACWEAARARPLYSMVTPLPDTRFTVLVQIDLRELVAHVQRAR